MRNAGNISCYVEAAVFNDTALGANIAVVALDRPGIGASTFDKNMSLTTVAHDVVEVADKLGIDKFDVFGCSAGGPYAAALAALFPDRILTLTLAEPIAPVNYGHGKLFKDLPSGFDKVLLFWARQRITFGVPAVTHYFIKKMVETDMERLIKEVRRIGLDVTKDERMRRAFEHTLRHAYKYHSKGLANDLKVLARDWKVDLSTIKCSTAVWWGEMDDVIPKSHVEWYKDLLGEKCELIMVKEANHIDLTMKEGDAMVAWIERHS